MSAASQYYSVTARVGVPHRHEVEVTIPLVGPAGATGPAGAAGASAWNDITGKPSTFAPSAHTHAANEITSGTLDNARINFAAPAAIGSGTPNTGAFASIRVDPKTGGTGSLVVGSTTAGETDRIVLDFDGIKIRAPGSDQVATIAAPTLLSENRSYQLPNASGTLALTESADNVFRIVGSSDATKKVAFEVDGLTTATTRTLTVPDASGTIARTEDFASPPAIGSTTPAAGSFTTLSANNGVPLTASAPVLDLAQTWDNSGVTFTGLKVTATDTNSAAASVIADFSLGSTSVFAIAKSGVRLRNAVGGTIDTFLETSAGAAGGDLIIRSSAGGSTFRFLSFGNECYCDNSANQAWIFRGASVEKFRITNAGGIQLNADQVTLIPDAANILAVRRGTNSQEARLYGTFTSSTNYQRMTVKSVRQTLSALSGASATTTGTFIPDGAVVVGVTTRVATALTGATGYQVGDGTDADRWGDINATALNTTSDNANWTAGTVECFTAGGEVTLTANGSNFTAGAIEICVFYLAGQAD